MTFEGVREVMPGSDPAENLRAGFLAEAGRPGIFERVRAAEAEIARLQAERVRLLGRLGEEALLQAELEVERHPGDDLDRWAQIQWRSAAMELAAAASLGAQAATRQLAEAWTLTQKCEPTLQVLADGEISFGHAQVIAREVADLDLLSAGEAQELLLPHAQGLSVGLFARKARQVLDRGDAERLGDRHARAFADRHLRVEGARDGMAWLTAYIDAADASVIATGLANAAEDARAAGDPRTRRQLEADLLTDVVLNGEITIGAVGAGGACDREATGTSDVAVAAGAVAGCPACGSGRRAAVRDRAPVNVEVLIPAATLAGHDAAPGLIPSVGMIAPQKARELVARAPSLRRILTDPIVSSILDFDRRTYRVPAELKRAILRRDVHCRAPGCSRPIAEIDHTVDYARGGTTSSANLAGLCRNHHHVKHEAGWTLTQHAGGILDWESPTRRHYRTHPDLMLPAEPEPEPEPESDFACDWESAPFDLPAEDDVSPDEGASGGDAVSSEGAASGAGAVSSEGAASGADAVSSEDAIPGGRAALGANDE